MKRWRYWGRLKVGEPIPSRVGSGQLHIAVPIRNVTNHELVLDYRYRFFDHVGEQTQNRSGWMTFRLPPRSISQIAFTSLNSRAGDFYLNIRPAK